MRARVSTAMTALIAAAVLAACGSSGGVSKPVTVRITDPAIAKSDLASQFVTDLYSADHAKYWRTKEQGALVAQGSIYCVERGSATAGDDVRSEFKGLASSGVREFTKAAEKRLCPSIDKTGKIPGYYTGG